MERKTELKVDVENVVAYEMDEVELGFGRASPTWISQSVDLLCQVVRLEVERVCVWQMGQSTGQR